MSSRLAATPITRYTLWCCRIRSISRRIPDVSSCAPTFPDRSLKARWPMAVAVGEPEGVALPELVQWLPVTALDDPIGNVGAAALHQSVGLMTALIT
ncbi:hypothetical protein GORHZ_085_00210 [Gordonia rhizosphera NBRC 16068]|uniref:Uncharacterized protein n=1 Tax=Gordonia rhizosphera NBRC 16068 TaxID=1108045 RepID=K6WUC0_9ACTN|nr:hypothetical protein GORHZ_085_00210 [Gordonia rhizosphera NBRC 16068]